MKTLASPLTFIVLLVVMLWLPSILGHAQDDADTQTTSQLDVAAPAPHVRNVRWGMSQEEVRRIEKTEPAMDREGMLQYETAFADIPVRLWYYFTNDHLYNIVYWHFPADPAELTDGLKRFRDALQETYGPPADKFGSIPDNSPLDDNTELWMAVMNDEAMLSTSWNTANTEHDHMSINTRTARSSISCDTPEVYTPTTFISFYCTYTEQFQNKKD